MELKALMQVLRKRWWVVVLATVLVAGTTYILSITTTPRYSATATLSINPGGDPRADPFSSYRFAQEVAQTFVEQIKSPVTTQQVRDRLGMDYEPRKNVSVAQVRDTQLIEITAVHESPRLAKEIADTTAQVFVEQINAAQQARFQEGLDDIEAQIASIEQQIVETEEAITSVSDPSDPQNLEMTESTRLELTRLRAELSSLQTRYTILLRSAEDFRLAMARHTDSLSVFATAELPSDPVTPRMFLNMVLGLVSGLLLGISTIFLLEYLDDSIRGPEEVEKELGLAVLGTIARMENVRHRSDGLLTSPTHHAITIESYRVLRANLGFADVDNPGSSSITTTSVGPKEGKTTTLVNLGIVMAQGGKTVVLVDTDLRRPTLHQLFAVENSPGLSDLLLESEPQPAACLKPTGVEGLTVLTSGAVPKSPPDVLSSKKMGQIIESLRATADMVLFDSPPVMGMADAVVLAAQTRSTLLVVDPQLARRDGLRRAKEILEKADANVLGVVLNRLTPSHGGKYYYYGDYYEQGSKDSGA